MNKAITRGLVALLAVVTLGLTAGAVIPVPGATLPAIEGCQERTVDDTGQIWIHWSPEMMGHYTGSFRVSSGCSHQIRFWSRGWRFDNLGCGDMRVHLITSDRRTPWVRVCGGPEDSHTYTLASFLNTNERFSLEGRALQPGMRQPARWWKGEFRF